MNLLHTAVVGLVAPLWPGAEQVRHLDARRPHHVKHQQREPEAVKPAIELVDEGLFGHADTVRLEPTAQLLVRQVLVAAEVEHQLLGVHEVNLLVRRTQRHRKWKIVYELNAYYEWFVLDGLNNPFTGYFLDASSDTERPN